MADVKFVQIMGRGGEGRGGWTICLGSISHAHGPMGDQKTASYSGHPEFDSRSEEYPQVGLETFVRLHSSQTVIQPPDIVGLH